MRGMETAVPSEGDMVVRGSGTKSMVRLLQALAAATFVLALAPLASAHAAAPAVTISSPAQGGSTTESAPLFSGTTSDSVDPVTVYVFEGAGTTGTLVGTVQSSSPSFGAWSAQAVSPMRNGTYTAVAEQSEMGTPEPPGFSEAVTFTIDAPPPAVSLEPVASPTGDSTPTFSGAGGTEPGDAATVTVTVYRGSSTSGSVVASASPSVDAGAWSYTPPALIDGTYTVQATQRDDAGNLGESAARTFTVDTPPPAVSLEPIAAVGNDATPTFGGRAGATPGVGPVTLAIYKGTSASGTPTTVKVAPNGPSWSFVPTKAIPDGTYTALAEQSDEAGNVGKSQPSTFRIDTTKPKVTLVTPANGSSGKSESVLFSGQAGSEAGDGSIVTLNIYVAGSSEALESVAVERSGSEWKSTGSQLPAGEYLAQAVQSDTAGNTGISSPHAFTIRSEAPVVTLSTSAFVRRGAKLFVGTGTPEFRTDPGSGIRAVTLDVYAGSSASGEPIERSPMEESPGGAWVLRLARALPEGTYTAQAAVEDSAKNQGVSGPIVFTDDETPPDVTLAAPTDGSSTSSGTVAVAGTAGIREGDEPAVAVQVFSGATPASESPLEEVVVDALPDGSWSASVGGLAPGTYTVRAQQSDDVGNRGTSNASTFVVTAPPSSSPSTSTPSAPSPPSASFTWVPAHPTSGQSVSLVSNSANGSSAIGSYAWDLSGDGQFGAGGAVMTTSFATPGAHVVRLQVTDADGLSSTVAQTIAVAPAPPRLMQPFPIVRIVGAETSYGAKVSLLTVQAPAGATVQVSCVGHGCKTKTESRVAVASSKAAVPSGAVSLTFKRFERPLRAGVTLQIKVTAAGEIGKFTSFAIRRDRLPVRSDACLQPASAKPSACPSS